MKRKIKEEREVDLAKADCTIFARYWEDSKVNGVEDDAENPQMPCVIIADEDKQQLAWCPVIDLDNGQIINWQKGVSASIHYKSCNENCINIIDRECNVVKEYEGYVPRFLCKEKGYADYVIMDIDENGFIQNFDPNLDDIFEEE